MFPEFEIVWGQISWSIARIFVVDVMVKIR